MQTRAHKPRLSAHVLRRALPPGEELFVVGPSGTSNGLIRMTLIPVAPLVVPLRPRFFPRRRGPNAKTSRRGEALNRPPPSEAARRLRQSSPREAQVGHRGLHGRGRSRCDGALQPAAGARGARRRCAPGRDASGLRPALPRRLHRLRDMEEGMAVVVRVTVDGETFATTRERWRGRLRKRKLERATSAPATCRTVSPCRMAAGLSRSRSTARSATRRP